MTIKLVVFSTDWPVWVHNDSLYPMFMLILFGIQGFAKGLFLALLIVPKHTFEFLLLKWINNYKANQRIDD